MDEQAIERAKDHFGTLLREQLERVDQMKADTGWLDYSRIKPLPIGVCGGDGIGPYISHQSQRVLEFLLDPEVKKGDIIFKVIDGLTIENRAAQLKAIPDDVLEELKSCHVILKAPTTTPRAGDPWPNIESANVAMRRLLDLFANVRPVRIPAQGIDWTFFHRRRIKNNTVILLYHLHYIFRNLFKNTLIKLRHSIYRSRTLPSAAHSRS